MIRKQNTVPNSLLYPLSYSEPPVLIRTAAEPEGRLLSCCIYPENTLIHVFCTIAQGGESLYDDPPGRY